MDSKVLSSTVLKVIRFLECFICASGAFQLSERKFDFPIFAPIVFLIGSFIFFLIELNDYDNADVYIPIEILQGCLISFCASWEIEKMVNKNSDMDLGFIVPLVFAAFFIAVKLFVYFKTYEDYGSLYFMNSVKGFIITFFAMCALVAIVKFNFTVSVILTPIVFYMVKHRNRERVHERSSTNSDEKSERNTYSNRTSSANEDSVFFKGCNTRDKLEKRHRFLAKAFHPDSESGDTEAYQKMQEIYEREKKRFK